MTTAVLHLLATFDALSASDKEEAVTEILRRTSLFSAGDVPERALLEMADELFCQLDKEEAAHGQP